MKCFPAFISFKLFITSMWALFLIQGALGFTPECSNENDIPNSNPNITRMLNSDCNNVGVCHFFQCLCCDTASADDTCQGLTLEQGVGAGRWTTLQSAPCAVPYNILYVIWGLLVHDDNIFCPNNGSTAIPNYLTEVTNVLQDHNYFGVILPLECQICSASAPCDSVGDETSGTLLKFGTDLNTYYDLGCEGEGLPKGIPRDCDANTDFGAEAYLTLTTIVDEEYDFKKFTAALMAELSQPEAYFPKMYRKMEQTAGTREIITRVPTSKPTAPTSAPTLNPEGAHTTAFCEDYVNKVGDLMFLGGGASCRAHINESWPGGRTCESPYIICLPRENTPALDIMGEPYKNSTHRYTIEECKQECSYDQRCLGFEFVADPNSTSGDCLLLDDLELKIEDEKFDDDVNARCYTKLRSSTYCNPFFQGDDLSDEMLRCYCPNNRKGFYTKKVKRTVNNTRFCDNDSSVDERIRMAQANRMFHLCENWCLFRPLHPEQENWYWDPWKQCWRETYSARGSHRAYCDRVIRNPNSIELRYINHRSTHFCDTSKEPTSSPVPDVNTTWYLSDNLESCDEVCGRNGLLCAAEQTSRRFKTESELISAFDEAGFDCTSDSVRIVMNDTRLAGWALPGIRGSTVCVNRQPTIEHLMDMDSDCVRKIGVNWQRLCACY